MPVPQLRRSYVDGDLGPGRIFAADMISHADAITRQGYGIVDLDEPAFAGANDDARLTNALSHAAQQTHIPAVRFPARDVTLNTGGRAVFDGMKLIGPGDGSDGSKGLELGTNGSLATHRVICNVGTGTSALFSNPSSNRFNVIFKNLAFQGGNTTSQFYHGPSSGGATLFACNFHALTFYGFKHIFGQPNNHAGMTQVMFSGHWQAIASYDTAFTMGGSDNSFWLNGYLNIDTQRALGPGGYYLIWDSMQKTSVGYIYVTLYQGGWKGMLLTGSCQGTNFHGGTYEGVNGGNPSTAPVVQIDSGDYSFHGTSFNYVNPAGNNGCIIQNGGSVALYSPAYQRAGNAAATFPMLYQTGGVAQVFNAQTVSGEAARVRWSDGTTSVLTRQNKYFV